MKLIVRRRGFPSRVDRARKVSGKVFQEVICNDELYYIDSAESDYFEDVWTRRLEHTGNWKSSAI